MRNLVLSSFLYIFCFGSIALYTGVIYLIGQNFWPDKVKGSLILDANNNIRGSYLVAGHLKDEKYFKSRPKNPDADFECDIAIYNSDFKEMLINDYDKATNHYDITMIRMSSSTYDPYITRREALSQVSAISKARGINILEIYKLIDQNTLYKQKLFFELDIVNTSILNSILDGYLKP